MRILVTAGNTQAPIDAVRCITNIFTGHTGTRIALAAYRRGHAVTLMTSHPELVRELFPQPIMEHARWHVSPYRTFDELATLLESSVPVDGFDAIVHCAAVGDYRVEGVYDAERRDVAASKIKSHHAELWLRLTPTPKLVDRFRSDWGFGGKLVKFKLEVGVDVVELLTVAEVSRVQSGADWMVANAFETRDRYAYLGDRLDNYHRLDRADLPEKLIEALEG